MKFVAAATVLFLARPLPAVCQQRDTRTVAPFVGVHLFNATVVAVTGGISYRPARSGSFWAPVASGDIGVAGGQASLGLARYWTSRAKEGGGEISLRLQGSILRTWAIPFYVDPNQSFMGIEMQFMYSMVGLRVGYSWRIDGIAPGDNAFFSTGIVLGRQ
jgi:hypothetical protein